LCSDEDWGIGYYDGTSFNYYKSIFQENIEKIEFSYKGNLLVLFEDDSFTLCPLPNRNETKKNQLQNRVDFKKYSNILKPSLQ
jgi:hypothetical protein